MREHVACSQCRSRKQKCIIEHRERACVSCKKKGEICSAAKAPRRQVQADLRSAASLNSITRSNDQSPATVLDTEARGLLPDQLLCNELVELYFDLMHDKQHALFHRPSFLQQQRSGHAPVFIVLAMMAMVARCSPSPYFANILPDERGRVWADRSRKLFDSRTSAVSLTAVQGCALLANLAFIQGDSARESLYGAQQIRMVQLLGYPKNLSDDRIQREVEIRVWWTTWMMDTWTSASVGVPMQLVYEPEYPRPMEEEAFEMLNSESRQELFYARDSDRDTGLWNQMVPLTKLLASVHEFNRSTTTHSLSQEEIFDQVRELGSRLEYWQFCLPSQLCLTSQNLQAYLEKGFGRVLVALHLGYHHHSLQLYFQFLSFNVNRSKDQRLVDYYSRKCKEHAKELSNLMWTANTSSGLECLWSINGHLLVIASAVHLHTLLFEEDEDQISSAKEMLERNFQLLLDLQKLWPSLHLSMSRLRIFHRACRESTHATFDMNQWMLHFLQKYALPVEEQGIGPSPMIRPTIDDDWSESGFPLDAAANEVLQMFLER